MAEVLSQNEIDALLSALSSGDLEPDELQVDDEKQKVKLYNFRSPKKFTKDHIRTLELIHDNYGRIISTYLTGQIRTSVKVKIETIQQFTYEEFIHSVSNPTVLTIFTMPPLEGSILFETNPEFVYQIIDVLMGGNGTRKYKISEFTDIDKNVIKKINEGLISNLKLAWEDILDVEPHIESLETNPALNQTLAPNEAVALVTFSVEMGKNSTFINICIPFLSIEKILDKLVVQYWYRGSGEDSLNESRKKLEERLNVVDVALTGILGTTHVNVDDFLKLSPGDVITLDNRADSAVTMKIGDDPYYYAKPGIIGKNRGIQVLDIIDKDVENYD
jgi:flagellar motor switch protein FliM